MRKSPLKGKNDEKTLIKISDFNFFTDSAFNFCSYYQYLFVPSTLKNNVDPENVIVFDARLTEKINFLCEDIIYGPIFRG